MSHLNFRIHQCFGVKFGSFRTWTLLGLIGGGLILSVGCQERSAESMAASDASRSHDSQEHTDHDHATIGPHHGALIELGNEDYHAELVHEAALVTIYVLDHQGRNAVSIAAEDVKINVVLDQKPIQFRLPQAPMEGDTGRQSSRFQLRSEELVAALENEHADVRLSLQVDGKSYQGPIHHDHAHSEGH